MRRSDLTLTLMMALALPVGGCVVAPAPPPPSPPPPVAEGPAPAIEEPPPPLPVYAQPPIPAPGYLWTPGFWAYGSAGYYWTPGTWVQPPAVGLLWTPGYWGFADGAFLFHAGYWGPHIGFYGGINYGFGYIGVGYQGGFWNHGVFAYNRTVNNFGGVHITNVYNRTVISNTTINRVSYNGGTGGIQARPTQAEEAALHENHVPPTATQLQHFQAARNEPALRAAVNHGNPAIAATARPGEFRANAVPARGAAVPAQPNRQPGPRGAAQFNPRGGRPPEAFERPEGQRGLSRAESPAGRMERPVPGRPPGNAHPAAAHRPPAHAEEKKHK